MTTAAQPIPNSLAVCGESAPSGLCLGVWFLVSKELRLCCDPCLERSLFFLQIPLVYLALTLFAFLGLL